MVDAAFAEARTALASITKESEQAAIPGQFVSLVPQEAGATRQMLKGMSLYAMAKLVQAMEGHMPEGARDIKLQNALQFSVAAGPEIYSGHHVPMCQTRPAPARVGTPKRAQNGRFASS
jgi:hypothetical protein